MMGGTGSTRWNNHQGRPVAERSLPLALDGALRRFLQQAVGAAPDRQRRTITWYRGEQPIATCDVWIESAANGQPVLRLVYRLRDEVISEIVPIDMVPQRRGQRAWLRCPGCDRRCAVLYRPALDRRWRCRWCYAIVYMSSATSDKRASRLLASRNLAPALDALLHGTAIGDLALAHTVLMSNERRCGRAILRQARRRTAARTRTGWA